MIRNGYAKTRVTHGREGTASRTPYACSSGTAFPSLAFLVVSFILADAARAVKRAAVLSLYLQAACDAGSCDFLRRPRAFLVLTPVSGTPIIDASATPRGLMALTRYNE